MVTRLIDLVDILEKAGPRDLTSKNLAEKLEVQSQRTIFRDIQYLTWSCGYPIRFDIQSNSYIIDWEWGKNEGFLRSELKVVRKLTPATASPLPLKGPDSASRVGPLPNDDSFSEILKWVQEKIASWQKEKRGTARVGIFVKGCQYFEGLIARCVSILVSSEPGDVRVDDLQPRGGLEAQIALLRDTNAEMTSLIEKKLPACLKSKPLVSKDDFTRIEKLRQFRVFSLKPRPASFKLGQTEERDLEQIDDLLRNLLDFCKSGFMQTVAAVEPSKELRA
jgi:hypothetical protein